MRAAEGCALAILFCLVFWAILALLCVGPECYLMALFVAIGDFLSRVF